MVDRKTQLGNVAFGGDWAEALIDEHEIHAVLVTLRHAAKICTQEDPRSQALSDALVFVEGKVEKGAMLRHGFERALSSPLPHIRQSETNRYLRIIEAWCGQ
ncbi:hypothetical protein [Flexibacterium corallicola]|uniref:hypothetical protein n=1 Tax=Flexibacterium corallicola TaxID=3037259 RepID=UPI00286ECF3B|nr:hypothetical protein [Pseudovibrio sp. M1P-2-3]